MYRHGLVFTPAVVEIIRNLAGQGKSAQEIAEVVGSTPGSVRVKCCQLKIRLRRPRRRSPAGSEPRKIPAPKLVIHLRPAIQAALKRKAGSMQISAAELTAMLLEAIVTSNIYEAVLDRDESGRRADVHG